MSAMKYLLATIVFVIVATMLARSPAISAEGRPWLCRDKPVFSSDKPMRYEAAIEAEAAGS